MIAPSPMLPVLDACCTLQLSKGLNALVDAADFRELSRAKWFTSQTRRGGRFYAATDRSPDGASRRITLHRYLLGDPPGVLADHVNNDPLDCRRSNLRPASPSENTANMPKRSRGARVSSAFKGVARHAPTGHWQAGICRDRRRYYLGVYPREAEAAVAYDRAAVLLFGAFARTNEIPEDQAPEAARRRAIEQAVERRLARGGRAA